MAPAQVIEKCDAWRDNLPAGTDEALREALRLGRGAVSTPPRCADVAHQAPVKKLAAGSR